jgi:coenzyme F420-reducing hydrogenase beta subunit
LEVCSYNKEKICSINTIEPECYAAWNKNPDNRIKCSSGGIGFGIAEYLIEKGYSACGVRYNVQSEQAEHFTANNLKDYESSRGSKYLPSNTLNGFSKLNSNDLFVVFGTPCHIDSLRRFIQIKKIEQNYVLVDFFCHGVPSMNMWGKYLNMTKRKYNAEISSVSWRNKISGWLNSYVMTFGFPDGMNGKDMYSFKSNGDLFYQFFLGNYCLSDACYDRCKYKMTESSADIRIGDLWSKKYIDQIDGVSAAVALTEKGATVLRKLGNCNLILESIDIVAEGQMSENPKKRKSFKYVKRELRKKADIRLILLTAKVIDKVTHFKSMISAKLMK